jgi:hypothetical protein
MPDDPGAKLARPWRVIAAEVAVEQDSQKLSKLVAELNRALEEQGVVKLDGSHNKQS